MLAPGSKGWLNKYFELIRKNKIQLELEKPEQLNTREFIHFNLLRTGIVFGYPSELVFANNLDMAKWTSPEKLKVLLFESMLMIYQLEKGSVKNSEEHFKNSLLEFYANHNAKSVVNLMGLIIKESKEEKIEKALASRVEIKSTHILGGKFLSYLSNSFVYLDIVLYREFLKKKVDVLSSYTELAEATLKVIAVASYADGSIQEQEQLMFNSFLSSSNLGDKDRDELLSAFKKGMHFEDLESINHKSWLFRRYLMDIAALTLFSANSWSPDEDPFFDKLCTFLSLPEKETNMAIAMIDNFVLQNNEQIDFLQNRNAYEKMYSNLSKRWVKVLGRNKDKLATELKESKELVYLITKSTREELTKEEKETVKSQFMDIIKSMPALAIFMLPGGAILLPLVLKILPDLVPSAFRDNELDNQD
ncbi:MAG: LETM1-related biofilm-associated protein [Crocinitomicaceae bacterium]|jgi:ribosomal protein L7/L12|nr:LETM1-related biofilm-associated protein [Crocinitomicaceae bacterium]